MGTGGFQRTGRPEAPVPGGEGRACAVVTVPAACPAAPGEEGRSWQAAGA